MTRTSFADRKNPLNVDGTRLTIAKDQFEQSVQQLATSIQITNDQELELLVEHVKAQKEMRFAILDHHKPMKDQAFQLHRTICSQENGLTQPLTAAITENERIIGRYMQARETKRLEDQKRIQQQEEARFTKQIDKQATKLEKDGKPEEAEDLREAAARNLPVVHVEAAPKPEGVRAPKPEFIFEITDEAAVPREWCTPDEKRIKAYVKSVGDKAKIPGVHVFPADPKASVRI